MTAVPSRSPAEPSPSPSVPARRWWEIGDNPYAHLAIGMGIALVFVLTAIPVVLRGVWAVPTAIDRISVNVEKDRLTLYVALRDENDRPVAAEGYASTDLITPLGFTSDAAQMGEQLLYHNEYPVSAAHFGTVVPAPGPVRGRRGFGCRLEVIYYAANPTLQAAAAQGFPAYISVAFRLTNGQVLRRKSGEFRLGIPGSDARPFWSP